MMIRENAQEEDRQSTSPHELLVEKKLLNSNIVPIDHEQIPQTIELETRGSIQLRGTIPRACAPDNTSIMIRPDPNNSTIAFFEDEEGTICVQKNSDRSMKK